jgi:hypothetical protein
MRRQKTKIILNKNRFFKTAKNPQGKMAARNN